MTAIQAIEGGLLGIQVLSGITGISEGQRAAESEKAAINLEETEQKRKATQEQINSIDQSKQVFAAQSIAFEQRGFKGGGTTEKAFRTQSYENMLSNNKKISENLEAEESQDEIQKEVADEKSQASMLSGITQLSSSVFQGVEVISKL